MAESVASLVERLIKRAEYYEKAGSAIPTALVSSIQLETAKELREAASRLSSPAPDPLREFCQSEGPRGETICMLPLGHNGRCGWEKLGVKR